MMRVLFTLAVLAVLAFVYLTNRTPDDLIGGQVEVIDGDSLELGQTTIRLFGIDSTEGRQQCVDEGGSDYRCGETARRALIERLGRQPVQCQPIERDQYDRTVARCFIGDQDIAAWMVTNGHALAYRQYSADYIDEEDVALSVFASLCRGAQCGNFKKLTDREDLWALLLVMTPDD